MGAVMGSKNLKAIAVRGTVGVKVDNPKLFMDVIKEAKAKLAASTDVGELTDYGTNAMIDAMQEFGGLPTRNFNEVQFEGVDKINPAAMEKVHENGHRNRDQIKPVFAAQSPAGEFPILTKIISPSNRRITGMLAARWNRNCVAFGPDWDRRH